MASPDKELVRADFAETVKSGPSDISPDEIEFRELLRAGDAHTGVSAVWSGTCRMEEVAIKVLVTKSSDGNVNPNSPHSSSNSAPLAVDTPPLLTETAVATTPVYIPIREPRAAVRAETPLRSRLKDSSSSSGSCPPADSPLAARTPSPTTPVLDRRMPRSASPAPPTLRRARRGSSVPPLCLPQAPSPEEHSMLSMSPPLIEEDDGPDYFTEEAALEAFRAQMMILSKVFHPNICLYLGACTTGPSPAIVMALEPNGDLERLLIANKHGLPLYRRLCMAADAARGMVWLHEAGILHGDLKPSSMLIGSDNHIKICNFGLFPLKNRARHNAAFCAPEVLKGGECTKKSDAYSFGLCLWEILTFETPYDGRTTFKEIYDSVVLRKEKPGAPQGTLPILALLLTSCLCDDPEQRPDFREVLSTLLNAAVDCAITDAWGNRIWKTFFLDTEFAKWDDFVTHLTLHYPHSLRGIRLKTCDCLRQVLVEPASPQLVPIHKFGKFLSLFGPVEGHSPETTHALFKFQELSCCSYFFGEFSTEQAEALLSLSKNSSFLVRFSRQPSCFAISTKKRDSTLSHTRWKLSQFFNLWPVYLVTEWR
eukprot:TRINITY_DN1424_c0_g1_i1.p1 TRINITY_DN1424_c0_g1~~TRINITY_DN1424_c0_g1_i1.p1  ORF type:complete len:604 (+),score=115.81 TRINITY_DN1424_c0_g1_i1:30-1814(+)